MPVAKSYEKMEIVGDVYKKNGRSYVQVNTGSSLREVRWYTEAEYQRMYGAASGQKDPYFKTQKELLGFSSGFITMLYGDNTYDNKEYFKSIGATYRKFWGWGLAGDLEVPDTLPAGTKTARIDWEKVGNAEGSLYNDETVEAYIDSILYAETKGEDFGVEGERYELTVTVDKVVDVDGYYGTLHIMTMHDDANHIFVWKTNSKRWEEGDVKHIKGTVKEHKTYRGTNQTILTRCSEIA